MSLCRSERVAISHPKKRQSKSLRSPKRFAVEPLEHRHLLTLLGVSPSFPTITYDSTGTVTYNATTDSFALQAQPLLYKASAIASPQVITTPRSFTINVNIDSSGNLVPNVLTSDLIVTGTVVGSPGLSGTILTAKVIAFGYQYTGSGTDNYDFIAIPTGGTLFSMFAGQDVGVTVASANSTFTNNFNVNFSGLAKGTIGSVPLFTGNINGTKYNDHTGNGITGDDTGMGGVTINLFRDLDNSGTLTPGDGPAIATTTTAAGTGAYSFNNLVPGTYFVQETVPSGQTQTAGGTYTVNVTSGSNTTGIDFADFVNINISGTKFNDLTGDGLTGDDTPLGGVTINLYLNGGSTPVASTVTAADGSYSFNNLGPGTYYVQEAVPSGSTQTGGNAGYTVSATSGSNSTGNNFSNFNNIAITGTKFNDITGDGFSADDTPLAGVTINLYLNGNPTPIASTVTAADGSFAFNNLGPGTYYVQETVPAGWTQTGGTGGYTITTTSGSGSSGNNFDDFQNISLSGVKYDDLTGDGITGDDTGLGGVTVNLYLNGNPTPVASTVTAADGSYSFSNLGPGTYTVQEEVPGGSTQTAGNSGYTVSATSGSNSSGNDFANFANISISGTKYNDQTGDGITADDTGLGGVTVNLYLNGNPTPVASTVTAADGSYSFSNLGPGTYTVQEEVPAGSTQTAGNAGYTVSATSGSNSSGNDFANFANISISGTKFNDLTGNGITGDDTGLGGVTVNLYLNGNPTPVASTVTAADGSYSFSNLGPGSYTVQEVVPAGSTQTAGNIGYTVSATSGTNSTGNNFANFQNISISGTKYNDLTGNSFSADDTPLAGITIVLYKNGGSTPVASTVTASNGTYSFSNLGPGTYTVQEVVPAGYTQTGGLGGYTINATSGTNVGGKDFDNFKNATTPVTSGDFATIGFWQNKNGQKVINSFNGSTTSTALGNWLATTFPNLFGTSNPYTGSSLAGKTNAQVAAIYTGLWTPNGVTKNTYVQAFATALGIYSTTKSLGGDSLLANGYARKYGFHVTSAGSGNDSVTIGSNSSAFGTSGSLTVLQILQIVNNNFSPSTGNFYGGDQTKTSAANNVLNGINTNGDINIVADGGSVSSDLGAALLLRSIADLKTGIILVAVDPLDGDQAAAELARIADAIASLNVQLGNYGVTLVMAGAEDIDAADIYIHVASTSDIGGVAEGVLGVTEFGGEITIISGWNYYLGTDPTTIGANQYDFQTVATHELSHALGLGHSADGASVMFPFLGTSSSRRDLSANDLLFIDYDASMQPEALLAISNHPLPATALAASTVALPTIAMDPVIHETAAPLAVRFASVHAADATASATKFHSDSAIQLHAPGSNASTQHSQMPVRSSHDARLQHSGNQPILSPNLNARAFDHANVSNTDVIAAPAAADLIHQAVDSSRDFDPLSTVADDRGLDARQSTDFASTASPVTALFEAIARNLAVPDPADCYAPEAVDVVLSGIAIAWTVCSLASDKNEESPLVRCGFLAADPQFSFRRRCCR